jgi:two-component system, cell cycle sensor histidine kinase and response regulator CckA
MHADPSLPAVDPELLVLSIEPRAGSASANEEWERSIGTSRSPWQKLAVADAIEARRLVMAASGGEMTTAQFFLVPGEPDPRPILLNFIPVQLADRSADLPVIVTGEVLESPGSWNANQTEQHRMETLGRMTMGIAHDVNNLLSGIIGHSELMKSALNEGPEVEELQEHVRTIERAALDGGALIQKIQRYIRREQRTAFIPLDLPTLIQDCIVLTRPYWYNEPRRQGIAISIEQQLDQVPAVLGSASELRDVLVNLILNAVQAMPGGGLVSFRCWCSENRVCLSIHDTGVGMSPAVRQRIFEPLYTTKGDGGTGMGLAVVAGVVREHDGSIRVQSSLGTGTGFTLEFPAGNLDIENRMEDDTPEEIHHDSLRILVVDDETMVRTVLRKLLVVRGHRVTVAASGVEGLEELGRNDFDAIITDQAMPEMNGREFARKARELSPLTPIALLTGDTHIGSTDHTISAVLAKPFKIDEVEATLAALVGAAP